MSEMQNISKTTVNRMAFRVVMGVLLLFFCAQVSIPLKPIPITLHSVGVLILALTYSKREAMQSTLAFIILGVSGLPIFTGFGSGYQRIIGPTGGYILGMLLCCYVVTSLREKYGDDSWQKTIVYSAIGTMCLFVLGISQLALYVGLDQAIQGGFYPFIIPGMFKALLTVCCIRTLRSYRG